MFAKQKSIMKTYVEMVVLLKTLHLIFKSSVFFRMEQQKQVWNWKMIKRSKPLASQKLMNRNSRITAWNMVLSKILVQCRISTTKILWAFSRSMTLGIKWYSTANRIVKYRVLMTRNKMLCKTNSVALLLQAMHLMLTTRKLFPNHHSLHKKKSRRKKFSLTVKWMLRSERVRSSEMEAKALRRQIYAWKD